MSKLNTEQEQKMARLLRHFSAQTNSEILGRFDRSTRNRIRQAMSDINNSSEEATQESLQDFAEFLYFEPHKAPSDGDSSRMSASKNQAESNQQAISFTDIVRMSNEDLDKLLQAAPVELTLKALCCSPESFVRRVVERLSEEDAVLVRERINNTSSIDYSEMQTTHFEFCRVATSLIRQGQIAVRRGI